MGVQNIKIGFGLLEIGKMGETWTVEDLIYLTNSTGIHVFMISLL